MVLNIYRYDNTMKPFLPMLLLVSLLGACSTIHVQPEVLDEEILDTDESGEDLWTEDVDEINSEKLEELEDARRELHLLIIQTEFSLRSNELDLIEAEEALDEARRALRLHMSIEMPRQIENAEQSLAYQVNSLKNAEDELAQLEQLYGDAEFAEATAEIVIGRARRSLEMERIDMRHEEEDLRNLHKYELPQAIISLERDIRRAELELEGARVEMEVAEIEAAHEIGQAEDALSQLEEDLGVDEDEIQEEDED